MENADVLGSSTAPQTWHDFLERMRQPSATDFVKAIKSFIVSFLNNTPDPERDSAAVQVFLSNMEAAFRAHSLWAGCSEEELDSAGSLLEEISAIQSSLLRHEEKFANVNCWFIDILKVLERGQGRRNIEAESDGDDEAHYSLFGLGISRRLVCIISAGDHSFRDYESDLCRLIIDGEASNEENCYFCLGGVQGSQTSQSLGKPIEMKGILAEFSNLIPDYLPNELPPMLNIKHAIELVPGSVSPNLLAYRMSPEEHDELRRQRSLQSLGLMCGLFTRQSGCLLSILQQILSTRLFHRLDTLNIVIDNYLRGLEKYVMTKLSTRAFASLPDDVKVDDQLHEKMALLQQFVRPENLDIPVSYQNEPSLLVSEAMCI
ncbi:hypothetical protein RJ640_026037 [Escallonia rubra]|uniref:RABX5 catalytic core helical domain-containing protein n=1 Tax=Escallonia rubra TaxID=112253 RepID=A0AA88SN30_9ASTE|nr:hypothetical protein RJ640_026037 [Escallonia rubra]